ncbi:MAG TPA: hypothetical protein ENK31_01800 [Nannocystis exedens]|nr:hypothetical protein [Nannocystis exedens]
MLALRRRTQPNQALGNVIARTSTWSEVAQESLRLAKSAEPWSDDAALSPQTYQAQARFEALTRTLERFGGPLSKPPTLANDSPVFTAARKEVSTLQRLAAELRWLRGVVDPCTWGAAVGRLRGLARNIGDRDLRRVLNPSFSPRNSWALHLGEDPTYHRIAKARPSPNANDTLLLDWLVSAIESSLPLAQIHILAQPISVKIAALDCQFDSRRSRKRLRKLLSKPSPIRNDRGHRKAGSPSNEVTTHPHAAEVRALIQGWQAALLTNRESPKVREAIEQQLGLSCDIHINKVRRRQALCSRIQRGSYDLVMVAHGFVSHSDTATVRDACSDSNTPYVAVGKGRPTNIIQVLYENREMLDARTTTPIKPIVASSGPTEGIAQAKSAEPRRS